MRINAHRLLPFHIENGSYICIYLITPFRTPYACRSLEQVSRKKEESFPGTRVGFMTRRSVQRCALYFTAGTRYIRYTRMFIYTCRGDVARVRHVGFFAASLVEVDLEVKRRIFSPPPRLIARFNDAGILLDAT